MDVKVARNLKRENIADAVHQLSDSIIQKVVKSKRPVIISDAMHDDEFANSKSVMKLSLQSVICLPLLDRGKLLGIIYVNVIFAMIHVKIHITSIERIGGVNKIITRPYYA